MLALELPFTSSTAIIRLKDVDGRKARLETIGKIYSTRRMVSKSISLHSRVQER